MTVTNVLPSATVVMAAYQAATTLTDCLESLTRLEYPRERLELVCVDNDSTDETPAIIRRFAPAVSALHESRRGAAAARNRGVAHARSEVIAFTDADCTVTPSWLAALVTPLTDPRVAIAGGRILARRPCNRIERFGERVHDHAASISATGAPYAISMNWASRRDVLERYGGFDERLLRCQDVELSFRMLRDGMRLAYVDEAVVFHQNERTLGGLFREGYVHGYHGRAVVDLHQDFFEALSPNLRPVRRLARAVGTFRHTRSLCDTVLQLVFDAGKLLGAARAAFDARS